MAPNNLLALLLLAFLGASVCYADNYALLIAGSNGYYNYRHQADVCHAFHVLTDPNKGNFPAENIIVFMYDDIAQNTENPVKGNLINHPNGTNVYEGVNKDYTGDDVNPKNFLAVLSGNKSAITGGNGKVLETTEEDNIFVYFTDHGAPGLIAFPSEYLYAKDLIATLKYMSENNKYKKLVFYLEACESGSMFADLLPDNINVFATTAATATQSSYACYFDASRGTYLGDEYSVRWMEDSDVHNSAKSSWTLEQQFRLVSKQTIQSQPQQYGDMEISKEVVEDFQGFDDGESGERDESDLEPNVDKMTPCMGKDSRDVKLESLLQRQKLATTEEDQQRFTQQVQEELLHRSWEDYKIDAVLDLTVGGRYKHLMKTKRNPPRDFECLKSTIDYYEQHCGRLSDYSLKWVYVLVNLCEERIAPHMVRKSIDQVCASHPSF